MGGEHQSRKFIGLALSHLRKRDVTARCACADEREHLSRRHSKIFRDVGRHEVVADLLTFRQFADVEEHIIASAIWFYEAIARAIPGLDHAVDVFALNLLLHLDCVGFV